MTLPTSGPISFETINTEIGAAIDAPMSLTWIQANTKTGATDLRSIVGMAWYQSNMAGNCNNGNCTSNCNCGGNCTDCNCASGQTANCNCVSGQTSNCNPSSGYNCNCSALGNNCNCSSLGSNCNCTAHNCTAINCSNCLACTTIDCSNCDTRSWLQADCNCNCTYNCNTTAQVMINCTTVNCNCNCTTINCNCVTSTINCACDCTAINCNCNCSGSCFPAGSQVLMADWSWKNIEDVRPGDFVMGVDGKPHLVSNLEVLELGAQGMYKFADDDHIWSSEHIHWTRSKDDHSQYWWSVDPMFFVLDMQSEVARGMRKKMPLADMTRVRTGMQEHEFAHVDGWKDRKIINVTDQYSAQTLIYLPENEDAVPIIINGYVVSGWTDEKKFDYDQFRWNGLRKDN